MLTMYNTKQDFEQTECTVAVLPVGAIEQHGSHLPVGTDAMLAHEFAGSLARHLDAYLLPVVPISSSIEHRKGKGTVYIKAETLAFMLRDIAESLQYSGFRKLVIVNFHGGNWIMKPTVRRMNRELADMQVILLHADIAVHRHHEVLDHVHHDVHAGEFETSLMLHLHPGYVSEIAGEAEPVFVPQSFMDYFDATDLTGDGYWGFPRDGTAEKGKHVLDLMVKCGLDYIREVDEVTSRLRERDEKTKRT